MSRSAFTTDKIAAPVGPFSSGIRAGEFLYLSGQVAQNPATGRLVSGDVGVQTEQIFRNVEALLGSVGKTLADVVKVTVFLTDMNDFAVMNAVYGRQFVAPHPARTTVAVAALPLAAAVELDVIAR
jgi:2-iminobutanoate/2-iminopropanoate deaminase